jgi:hypothetical protein
MVAKCSNPACNREFRELSKGRLFLLPPTHNCYADPAWKVDKLSDYCYWLCPECDVTHTDYTRRVGSGGQRTDVEQSLPRSRSPRTASQQKAGPRWLADSIAGWLIGSSQTSAQ